MIPGGPTAEEFEATLGSLRRDAAWGERGFFGPGSLTWKINREAILHFGGPRALLMQIAHPKVAQAVADHSRYQTDPWGRIFRTFGAVYTILFGTTEEAIQVARKVHAVHATVRGTMNDTVGRHEAGTGYSAHDPELLLWVFATLFDSALWATHRLVRPLTAETGEAAYQESRVFAHLFSLGDDQLPPTHAAFRQWFADTIDGDDIAVGDSGRAVATELLRGPPGLRPSGPALRTLAAGSLPAKLREGFDLPWNRRTRWGYRAMCIGARVAVRTLPSGLRVAPMVVAAQHPQSWAARVIQRMSHRDSPDESG